MPNIRSKFLMELYRTIPCQNCNNDDGTVSGYHGIPLIYNNSLYIKASDEFCASLCASCQKSLNNASKITKELFWNIAYTKTNNILREEKKRIIRQHIEDKIWKKQARK